MREVIVGLGLGTIIVGFIGLFVVAFDWFITNVDPFRACLTLTALGLVLLGIGANMT